MWIEWSNPTVIVVNCLGLPALQLGCAWIFTRLPARFFDARAAPVPRRITTRVRRDQNGSLSSVRKWKQAIPDGAVWVGGMSKARLPSRDSTSLRRFLTETRRGEACHWAAMLLCTFFFLWNPPWACAVIALYAVVANSPCILIQRYNRARVAAILSRRQDATMR